jgi:Phospholipid methyltransferase
MIKAARLPARDRSNSVPARDRGVGGVRVGYEGAPERAPGPPAGARSERLGSRRHLCLCVRRGPHRPGRPGALAWRPGLARRPRAHPGRRRHRATRLVDRHPGPVLSVITTGPYRYVRHPSYSGVALVLLGIALACGDVLSLVAAALLAAAGARGPHPRRGTTAHPGAGTRVRTLRGDTGATRASHLVSCLHYVISEGTVGGPRYRNAARGSESRKG